MWCSSTTRFYLGSLSCPGDQVRLDTVAFSLLYHLRARADFSRLSHHPETETATGVLGVIGALMHRIEPQRRVLVVDRRELFLLQVVNYQQNNADNRENDDDQRYRNSRND